MMRMQNIRMALLYGLPIAATVAAIVFIGVTMGVAAMIAFVALMSLEIAFSIDNAYENARLLRRLPRFWSRIFLSIGIFIAVFGVRFLLPVIIVSGAVQLPFSSAMHLAIAEPEVYTDLLQQSYTYIAAFGAGFLLMIFAEYLIYKNRSRQTVSLHRSIAGRMTAPIVLILLLAAALPLGARAAGAFLAGILGVLLYGIIRLLSDYFAMAHRRHVQQAGFFSFLYLELLDAAFSVDGVVSAFAVTPNLLLITAGLSAGALWVRAMTVGMAHYHKSAGFISLDRGVHWAIGVLGVILLVEMHTGLPELLADVLALGAIGCSYIWDKYKKPTHRPVVKSVA